MNLQQIKQAVNDGKTVHWGNRLYSVTKSHFGNGEEDWNIFCKSNEHCIGLTWQDGKTMNGREEQFFINPKDNFTEEKLHELYLDYFNNFITVEKFAEHYNLNFEEAKEVIEQGGEIHHTNCKPQN